MTSAIAPENASEMKMIVAMCAPVLLTKRTAKALGTKFDLKGFFWLPS